MFDDDIVFFLEFYSLKDNPNILPIAPKLQAIPSQ